MEEDGAVVIALKSSVIKDPMILVATVAHELGHLILLSDGHIDRSAADHEPMTDLLTVFLGLGIFTANSAAQFKQHDHGGGWHKLVDAAPRLLVAGSLRVRTREVRGQAGRD
jgi:hypothetical protein